MRCIVGSIGLDSRSVELYVRECSVTWLGIGLYSGVFSYMVGCWVNMVEYWVTWWG